MGTEESANNLPWPISVTVSYVSIPDVNVGTFICQIHFQTPHKLSMRLQVAHISSNVSHKM